MEITPKPRLSLTRFSMLFWVVFGVFDTCNMLIQGFAISGSGLQISGSIAKADLSLMLSWLLWVAVTPLTVRLANRFPLDGVSKTKSAMLHLLFAVLLSVGHSVVTQFLWSLYSNFGSFPMNGPRFYVSVIQQIPTGLFIYGINVSFVYIWKYRTSLIEEQLRATKLEASLSQTKLSTLQGQLQPHFMFNTLNGISSLVRDGQKEPALEMIGGLGDLLRYSLESGSQQEVPLARELDFVSEYMAIQKMRFADRLIFTISVDEELRSALVPSMILQPLVENAIIHGLERQTRTCSITVGARKEAGKIILTVSDDGAGLPIDWETNPKIGTGLSNPRDRIEALYGSSGGFRISSGPKSGAEVRIEIPLHLNREAAFAH